MTYKKPKITKMTPELTKYNNGGKRSKTTKIAWHYTGSHDVKAIDTLKNWFDKISEGYKINGEYQYISSNYLIDLDGTIYEYIPENYIAYNTNEANEYSIGIECATTGTDDHYTDEEYKSMIQLGAYLADKYNLNPRKDFIRHYDVTGKICPKYFVNNPKAWEKFKNDSYNEINNEKDNAVTNKDTNNNDTDTSKNTNENTDNKDYTNNRKSQYSELAEKYKKMIDSRQKYNTVSVDDFIPNIEEMIKEDCVLDILEDMSSTKGDEKLDMAYYSSAPFSSDPGYYSKENVFVLEANNIASNSYSWILGDIDGKTINFYLESLNIQGKFTFKGSTYESFEDYIQKQCASTDRTSISLRLAGINTQEIIHYGVVTIVPTEEKIKKYTLGELRKFKNDGKDCNFLDYNIDKHNTDNPDKWTLNERKDSVKVNVYEKNGSYYEVINNNVINAKNIVDSSIDVGEPITIVVKNATTKDTILDGYKAQYRVKELLESDKIQNMILVIDANSQNYTKTYPTYTVYQTLYKFGDNVKNLIKAWIDSYKGIGTPLSKLNYSPFGTDLYGNLIGALYVNIASESGDVWIDVAKYVISGTNFTDIYKSDSPELNNIGNGFSNAINLDQYQSNSVRYVDNIDVKGIDSYNKKIELHKKLTGIDFTKMKDCTVMLGDTLFLIPPQNIRNVTNVDYERVPVMRGKGTMTKNKTNREQLLEIDLYFYEYAGINGIPYEAELPNSKTITYYMNGLRALISQFRLCPFLPIENTYINKVLNIEVVALVNLSMSTVDGFPRLLKATLTLRDFNYRVYMPDLPVSYYGNEENLKNISEGASNQIFGKSIEWELFRYYYQRALIHGEELSKYDFNTFEYSKYFYSYKNLFQLNDLTDNFIEFYIPDEEWLKSALQYKKAVDYSGQMIYDLTLEDKDQEFLYNIANLQEIISSPNVKYGLNDLNFNLNDTGANLLSTNSIKDKESYSSNNIPTYSKELCIILDNNKPNFDNKDKTENSFEKYSDLDNLGRCGVAYANLGEDLMPTGEREDITSISPSGWQEENPKYEFIDGNFLYNRCHLIGYQLTGENANKKNLITGTSYMNVQGMLPYENLVANYIKQTKNHVLYRVTPIFDDENLVAKGVHMEAESIEDNGSGIMFNVFIYNIQPGVTIDYSNGTSKKDKIDTDSNIDEKYKELVKYYTKNIFGSKDTKINLSNKGVHNFESARELLKYDIVDHICTELEKNPIVKSIQVDEEYLEDGDLRWPLIVKLDINKCSNINEIREVVKTISNAKNIKECLVDDTVTIYINSMFDITDPSTYKYVFNSVTISASNELNSIISTYYDNYDNEANAIGSNQDMFDYTKYKEPECMKFIPYLTDEDGNSKVLDVDLIGFSMSNTFTEMYLKSCDGYAPQFMGGSDIIIEAKFTLTEEDIVRDINKLPSIISQYTKTYRRIMPCYPLKVKNSYIQTLGLNEMLLDSVQVETIDGFPGAYEVRIRMTSVDRSLRQREALKKLDTKSYTTTISEASIINMFSIQKELKKAELYPDLDLPRVDELYKNGWKFLKYAGEERLFVDPDFYMIYSFKYTAQIIKELLYNNIYKKYLKDEEGLEKLTKNPIVLEDSMGIKMNARFDRVLGTKFENANEYADLYDTIIEDVSELSSNETLKKILGDKKIKEYEDLAIIGSSMQYLLATGMADGWELKSTWNAVLSDKCVNDNIEKLNVSGIDNTNVKDEEKDNKIYQDIYEMRSEAIYLIDKILEEELTYTEDNEMNQDIWIACKNAVENIFIENENGQKLLKLLNGGETPDRNGTETRFSYDTLGNPNIDNPNNIALGAAAGLAIGTSLFTGGLSILGTLAAVGSGVIGAGIGSCITNTSVFEDNPNILLYIQGFLYASALAFSSSDRTIKGTENIGYIDKLKDNLNDEETNESSNESKGQAIKIPNHYDVTNKKLTVTVKDTNQKAPVITLDYDKDIDWDSFLKEVYNAEAGGEFGMFKITTYSVEELVNMLYPNETIKYKYKGKNCNKMYPKEKENIFCQDNAFIDPYYNKAGHRSEKGKKYKKYILRYPTCNAEAYLRIVLMYLKRMIIEGYFFNELDSAQGNYDDIKKAVKEIVKVTDETKDTEYKDHGDDINISVSGGLMTAEDFEAIFGINVDQLDSLLEDIPKFYKKLYCARMIYPFIAALTEYDDSIMKYIKNRDYDTLNTFTACIEFGDNNNNIFNKFLSSLANIRMIGNTIDNNGTKNNISYSQKMNNLLMQEAFTECSEDPRKYVLHSFYDMVKNDKRGRLLRAFPTYYIVFVDEGRKIGSWKLFDNFYNMSSISELQVVKSRKIPADTCSFVMSNMYMSYAQSYDNSIYQQYVDVYGVKDIVDSIFSPLTYLKKEDMIRKRKQLKDTTVLSPGVRVHIRMGYGADASTIPIVFNGKIAEIEVGDVVEVICQGDGHELCNPLNTLGEMEAKSFQTSQHYITAFRDIRGSFMRGGESPRNLAAKLLNAEYNKEKKFIRDFTNHRFFAYNPFGIFHFGDRRFQDIFEEGETVQNLYEVSNESLLTGYNTLINDRSVNAATPIINCNIHDKTYWEILNMCANSGDGYYAAIRDFGFRSTVCLCKANQYYAYDYRKNKQNNVIYEKRKPFQQFHYYDSYNDIVYNTIKATEKNMKTNAIGVWQSTDCIWGTSQDTVGPIYLDMNIYPEYQKSMTVDTGLIGGGNGGVNVGVITHFGEKWNLSSFDDKVNKSLAEKITTNVLRNSVKDMYEGELCVIGDTSIKPFDSMCFVDVYEDMSGTVEVETVIHNFNAETGFTTTIVPDVVTCTENIEQKMGSTSILSPFLLGASTLTLRGGLSIALWKTGIATSTMADIGVVTFLKEMVVKSFSLVFPSVAANTTVSTAGGALWKVIGATPTGAIITAITVASVIIACQNLKDTIYRTFRNIQAISVFPIMKNQRLLIAGMAGHKGSIYGYPYPEGTKEDSIQQMLINVFDKDSWFKDMFISDYDFNSIFENWKANLKVGEDNAELFSESFSTEKNKMIFMQEVYDSISREFSSRSAYIQSLKTKPRIITFNKSNNTTEEYLTYQIGSLYTQDPNKEAFKDLSKEDKTYVTKDKLCSNKKLSSLIIIEDDDDIRLAMNGNHSVIKSFTLSHSADSAEKVILYRESGNREVRYLKDTSLKTRVPVYDFPMLQSDAMMILKLIINSKELTKCEINFESGTRVNDYRAWKSTGFQFTISSRSSNALKNALDSVREQTMWYSSTEKRYTFKYNMKGTMADIIIYAPTNQMKKKNNNEEE